MGNGPDFASARAKIGRSEDHFNTLKNEIKAWVDGNPYRLLKHHNADFTRFWATVKVLNEPPCERWSLIASDAFHNLRCALDHLMFAIAIFRTGMNPPPDPRKWSFPIRDTPRSFNEAIGRFGELQPLELRIIERFQPYNRPYSGLIPLLKMLREFDDFDKHRLLHVAMAVPSGFGWEFDDFSTTRYDLRQQIYTGEVADGKEIGSITFPNPAPNADPKFVADIAVSIAPPSDSSKRAGVAEILREVAGEVCSVVENLETVFHHRVNDNLADFRFTLP